MLPDAVEVLPIKMRCYLLLAESIIVLHILVYPLVVRCETGHPVSQPTKNVVGRKGRKEDENVRAEKQ